MEATPIGLQDYLSLASRAGLASCACVASSAGLAKLGYLAILAGIPGNFFGGGNFLDSGTYGNRGDKKDGPPCTWMYIEKRQF